MTKALQRRKREKPQPHVSSSTSGVLTTAITVLTLNPLLTSMFQPSYTNLFFYPYSITASLQTTIKFAFVTSLACRVQSQDISQEIEDEFLAEILAEEEKDAAEMAKLEAEMRELEELKAQHQKMHQDQHANKMKPGWNNLNKGSMPEGLNDIEEQLQRKEAQAAEAKKAEQQAALKEAEKKQSEEIARQREAAYLAELERIQDEKIRKEMQRQKRRDGQIVQRVLRNSENERHYAVLGLKCKWGEIKLGPIKFCSVPPSEVKRAYRTIARSVHPDKNRDGRAGEAFDALEKSAALLMDPMKKKDYDVKLQRQRKAVFDQSLLLIQNSCAMLVIGFKLLGPFATPIAILLALII
jgi:DnaJ-class molecular chaperone with C-terminal Zn finger domain